MLFVVIAAVGLALAWLAVGLSQASDVLDGAPCRISDVHQRLGQKRHDLLGATAASTSSR